MMRFFFHVRDGSTPPDEVGTELTDRSVARIEAVRRAGVLMSANPAGFWDGGQWSMDVADAGGILLFTLHFLAVARLPAGGGAAA